MKTTSIARRGVLTGLGAAAAMPAFAQTPDANLPDGLVGQFHAGGTGRRPGLLVLGGSEGGLGTGAAGAKLLAAEGFSSLGLAYFKAPGLPEALENIPLEYFLRALDWLAKQPSVDPKRIGVWGGSKGAEMALLLGSRDPRIKAVVAAAPSSVVWAGVDSVNQARMLTIGSSWSWKGQPLPYVRYDFSGFKGIRAMYDQSYAKAPAEAVIAVEKINGPMLLISGGKDELWPSTPMAEAMMERLDKARFPHKHVHLSYPDASHSVGGPPATPLPGTTASGQFLANQAAKADAWPKTLAFLKEALRA